MKPIKVNQLVLGSYESEYLLIIDSQIPLKEVYVMVKSHNIKTFSVEGNETGMFGYTIPDISDNEASQICFNTHGDYKVKITTGTQARFDFSIGYKK